VGNRLALVARFAIEMSGLPHPFASGMMPTVIRQMSTEKANALPEMYQGKKLAFALAHRPP
jgi:hypothetical protein